jgi:hypothetical protein
MFFPKICKKKIKIGTRLRSLGVPLCTLLKEKNKLNMINFVYISPHIIDNLSLQLQQVINDQELIPPQKATTKTALNISIPTKYSTTYSRISLQLHLSLADVEKLRMHLKCIASNAGANTTI